MDKKREISIDDRVDDASVDWGHVDTEEGAGDEEGCEEGQVAHLLALPAGDDYFDQFFDALPENPVDVALAALGKRKGTFFFWGF